MAVVPTRTLVVPGLRTRPSQAWRSDASRGVAAVAADPYLWLIGSAGFVLRGGVVALLMPMIVLPTQVEVRLALGGYLGSSGLTPDFWLLVALGAISSSVLALVALYGLARTELIIFDRLMADPEAELPPGDGSRQLARLTPGIVGRLFVVQAVALLGLCVAAVPLAAAIGQTTFDELLRPSSGASIYDRVLAQLGTPIAILVVAVVAIEIFSATATRRLLAAAARTRMPTTSLGASLVEGVIRPLRHPVRVLGTAALGWLATLAVMIPAVWAIGVTWHAVRAAFLATTSWTEVLSDPSALLIAVMLAAIFSSALLLAGFAGAVRAALWNVDALR